MLLPLFCTIVNSAIPAYKKAGNRFSSNEYTEDEQISSLYQTSRLNRRKPNEPLSIGMKRPMIAIC